MSDPVFVSPLAALTLADIVRLTGASPPHGADPARLFDGVASLDLAGRSDLSVFDGRGHHDDLSQTRVGACFVTPADGFRLPVTTLALVTDTPCRAFATLIAAMYPAVVKPASMFATRGISPVACIHSEARLEDDVTVDPGAVIGPKAEIGAGTTIGANSVIGPQVRIGRNCAINAQVTIANALIGNGVIIHSGARIGQDGSVPGSTREPEARMVGLGRVIIQDGVEIGANTTIDRGGLGDTILGEGCRIDSLVHVPRDQTVARHASFAAFKRDPARRRGGLIPLALPPRRMYPAPFR